MGGRSNGTAARLRAAQWLESSAEQSVGVPVEHAYSMWEDRTRIPQWMPWISSVTVGRHSQDPPALQSLLSSNMVWSHGSVPNCTANHRNRAMGHRCA